LPDIATLGVTWKIDPHWAVTGILRLIHSSDHQQLALRIIFPGSSTPTQEILSAIPLYRGFSNAWDLRGRLVYEHSRWRLGGTLRVETAAVPKARVTAASVDGIKVEPMFSAELNLWRRLSFAVSYAFTYMLPVETGDSAFHPASASICAQVQGDLDHVACQDRRRGLARSSAAGRYTMNRHTLTLLTRLGF
jgi:long-subunit fatty acid transport protein